jgi:NADH-quinone oxidoreductase subunit J
MLEWILFAALGAVAIGSALAMVLGRNPVHSALWLVLTFFCVGGLFLMLGAQFLFAVQVIVYAGAIMVLFLFVVMLLNLDRESEPLAKGTQRLAAGVAAASFLAVLAATVGRRLGFQAAVPPQQVVGICDIGTSLFNEWFFPFELASVLLLVAMVGAIVLARRRTEKEGS